MSVTWESLEPVFRGAYESWLGSAIRESTWAFAYIEVLHLIGLTLLLGCVVAMSLRLNDLIMREISLAELAKEVRPYMLSGLAIAIISGLMMLSAEADRCYTSTPFKYKMLFLAAAIIFQFTIPARLVRGRGTARLSAKIAGLISLALWFAVGWSGRAIAFFN